MKPYKHASATATDPAVTDTGTEGYNKAGTPGDPTSFTTMPIGWFNSLIKEIKALATGNGEAALDPANDHQIHDRLGGAAALLSNALDLGATALTTLHHAAIIVGDDCKARARNALATGGGVETLSENSFCMGEGARLGSSERNTFAIGCKGSPLSVGGVTNEGLTFRVNGTTGKCIAKTVHAGTPDSGSSTVYMDGATGFAHAVDYKLTSAKAAIRNVPIAAAQCIGSAGDWVLNGPPVAGQTILHWTPSAAGKYLAVPLPNRVGGHVGTVDAFVRCNVTSGSKVRGRVYATNATGTLEVSDEVEWTYASDGAKSLTCSDHTYITGRTYYVAFWVDGGDTAPTNAAEGLFWVRENGTITEI